MSDAVLARLCQKGCIYTLVKRQGHYAIYSLQYTPKGRIIGYDLITVKARPKRAKIAGVLKDTGILMEAFPASEEWGRSAWSFTTLEKAEGALINKGVPEDSFCPSEGVHV